MRTINLVSLLFLFYISTVFSIRAQERGIYEPAGSISLHGDGGYDYLYVDSIAHQLFVSHGGTVHVVDLRTEKAVASIDGMQGVHGIAIAQKVNRGFISDGKANAVVAFDLRDFKILSTIPVTGKKPDAITYDPFSGKIFVFNGETSDASVIDPEAMKQVGSVDLGGSPEFGVPDGKGLLYNNLEDQNMMAVINTGTLKVYKKIELAPCGGPTGLALDFDHARAFTACRGNKGMSVIDLKIGAVIATVPIGAGVDAVAYDPQTKLIFCSNGDGTTTVIKQESENDYRVVQTLKTPNRAKTLALDRSTHRIYLSAPEFEPGTKNIVPGTFRVWVYKLAE